MHVDYRKVGNPSQDFVDQLSKKIQFAFTSQGATLPELRVFILKRKSKSHYEEWEMDTINMEKIIENLEAKLLEPIDYLKAIKWRGEPYIKAVEWQKKMNLDEMTRTEFKNIECYDGCLIYITIRRGDEGEWLFIFKKEDMPH